ncbi:alpha/beta hydrolase [Saccharomonospora piscinae]|uniref:Alpha/beta hydrolase n=1 Tax=Saccharomonospora piscinae TaxID=687388 RepID=A0A1V9A251_SACPI|nr:alpha/beta hydrolase [Saccharomonospora piscinae]OQO91116.1 alpha/beta hydrolase [Saccharomonospora piscinae]
MSRSGDDATVEGPFAGSRTDRTATVAADDGAPLAVEEIEPLDGHRAAVTVVGVHGFALSRRSWYLQRRDLAGTLLPGARHVYYDHRGHGQSASADAQRSTIEQLAVDLHAVLRTAAPDTPVVLWGHSMGGMVIMELAQSYPDLFAERIQGVALIATAAGEIGAHGLPRSLLSKYNPLMRGVGELAEWQPGLVEFVRAAGGQLTRAAVRRLAFGARDVDSHLVDFMLDMLGEAPVRQLSHFVDTLGSHNRYAALAGLKHTDVVVIGGDADRLTPFAHAERIAAELPRARLVRVEGAGHMVHMEEAEVVNRHLADLVRRCGGDGAGKTRRNTWWRS